MLKGAFDAMFRKLDGFQAEISVGSDVRVLPEILSSDCMDILVVLSFVRFNSS